MTKVYEMKVKIQKIVHYSPERGSGIYGCVPIDYDQELIRNRYRNVAIQGDTRPLAQGEVYTIKFEGHHMHDEYGAYYNIIEVETEKLDTIESQNRFLKAILSPNQYDTLLKAYPNEKLVDLIVANQIDTSKTKGIKEKTLDKIKDKIQTNDELSVVIAGSEGMGFTTNQLKKINDHYKDAAKAIQAIQSNIYELCVIDSFGFLTIDKIAMERGDDPYNSNRIQSAINYTIQKELDSGHTWIKRGDLLDKLVKLMDLQLDTLIESVNKLSQNDYFHVSDNRITFSYVYRQEKSILEELNRIAKSYQSNENEHDLSFKIKQLEAEQGFAFTEEQLQVLIEGNKHGVMVVNGKGGVGKSLLISAIIKVYGFTNYITVALSGKATQVLASKGIESSTIHRAIGVNQKPEDRSQMDYDLVVADEFSMVDVNLSLQLLEAVKNGAKLIIVGDSGQLPAIGYGDVLRDLLATQLFPTFELTQVHRQAAQSGILSLANSIRKGIQPFQYDYSGTETFGELQDQTVISYANKDNIPNDIVNIAKAYSQRIKSPSDLFDFQVIVSNRERGALSVKSLNIQLQAVFNDMKKPTLNRNGYEYREGDKIITQGNAYGKYKFNSVNQHCEMMERTADMKDKEAKEYLKKFKLDLFNGTMGYIHTIDKNSKMVFICIEGAEGVIGLGESELDKIDMAYAATCHKLQGSGIKNVIFALDYGAYKLLSKQLVYTALTRASVKGVALVENNAFHAAIQNDASGNRRTFLADLINDELETLNSKL
jgi:RecD/TraA family predicted helicase